MSVARAGHAVESFAEVAPALDADTRPLDTDEVAIWRGFLRWSEGVTAAVKRALSEEVGVSHADYSVLIRLVEAGGAPPRQTLEQSLSWSTSRLSHQLRRMESRQLVRRTDTGCGRQVDVELTDAGRRLIAAAQGVHAKAVRAAFFDTLPAEFGAFLRRTDVCPSAVSESSIGVEPDHVSSTAAAQ